MSWEEDARRVAEIFGVQAGQRLPAVSRKTLRQYHTYLTAHLVFLFRAVIEDIDGVTTIRSLFNELVASFQEGRRFSPWPWWKLTAAYASGAVRKMRALRSKAWDGNARDGSTFCACAPEVYWPRMHVFSPHISRSWANWKNSQPVPNVINVTSVERLFRGWMTRCRGGRPAIYLDELLPAADRNVPAVTMLDGHPLALSWLGNVLHAPLRSLGVTEFGESASLPDLYHKHQIDADAVLHAMTQLLWGDYAGERIPERL